VSIAMVQLTLGCGRFTLAMNIVALNRVP